jgi:hypothetical protein
MGEAQGCAVNYCAVSCDPTFLLSTPIRAWEAL